MYVYIHIYIYVYICIARNPEPGRAARCSTKELCSNLRRLGHYVYVLFVRLRGRRISSCICLYIVFNIYIYIYVCIYIYMHMHI